MNQDEDRPRDAPSDPAVPPFEGRPPSPLFNWRSGIGAAITVVSLTATGFPLVVEALTDRDSGYGGLFLLPPLVVSLVGLGLVVSGWLRERRRQRLGIHSSLFEPWSVTPWLTVQRIGPIFVLVVLGGGTIALLSAATGSLALVRYSESNHFCTQACHTVMRPQGERHVHSPHSRVDCVDCHVVPGAAGYLEAKLGGLRQVWALATDRVSKPIPPPEHGGAPSHGVCQDCHDPGHETGYETVSHTYFPSDEETFPIGIAMAVKVGSGDHPLRPGNGIHYHMQVAQTVEYIARKDQGRDIAWVRVTDDEGKVREYEHASRPLGDEERRAATIRTVGCIDCHNRVAHRFPPATESVNRALAAGQLPVDAPSIKLASVRALDGDYATTAEALEGIAASVGAFYEEEHPAFAEEEREVLEETVRVLQDIYRGTIFPEMETDWTAHPDHGGHLDFPGCFRCHNEEMSTADGAALVRDCSTCHALLAEGRQAIEGVAGLEEGMPFVHPGDWETMTEFSRCSDCHTGGAELYE